MEQIHSSEKGTLAILFIINKWKSKYLIEPRFGFAENHALLSMLWRSKIKVDLIRSNINKNFINVGYDFQTRGAIHCAKRTDLPFFSIISKPILTVCSLRLKETSCKESEIKLQRFASLQNGDFYFMKKISSVISWNPDVKVSRNRSSTLMFIDNKFGPSKSTKHTELL